MVSLQDFIAKYIGQFVDFDGVFGAQCVDLMNQYIVDVLGISNPIQILGGATAYEIYQNANDSRFTKIINTPNGVPNVGDMVFWDTTIGNAGHVDIFLSGDTNSFTGFDQNWPVGSPCHQQTHDYNGVAGWLHPIQQATSPSPLPPNYDEIIGKATNWDNVVKLGFTSPQDVSDKISNLQTHLAALQQTFDTLQQSDTNKQTMIDSQKALIEARNATIASQQAQIGTLTTQSANFEAQVNTLKEQAIKVPALMSQVSQAESDLQKARDANATANRVIAQLNATIAQGKPKSFIERLKYLFT